MPFYYLFGNPSTGQKALFLQPAVRYICSPTILLYQGEKVIPDHKGDNQLFVLSLLPIHCPALTIASSPCCESIQPGKATTVPTTQD